jgi:hypothetical protein
MLPGTETIHWGDNGRHEKSHRLSGPPGSRDCTLAMSGSEEEVIQLAVLHATTVHGYTDSPELRQQLRSLRTRLHARPQPEQKNATDLRGSDLI